ncbi:MAG: bifunctional (p)ppGpp synthetase/guanosine-3',5'-bis(diphosphate) 3'-pyrophosphohydrolase [Geminicoccaceae bacterium]
MRQYDLVELVKSYDPNADENLLNRAYVFAMKAHGSQLRASGDPYFHHPVEVAGILAGYKLDSASIATGLLHDTVEDTGVTLDEIRSLFGDTVARLVDGVTKLNKIHLQSAQTAQAENFRKLLLAMSEDIRVLLVKLADRLHNMRTLHFIKKPEKRRRIATETSEIYAPLAARIGMDKLKAELEDLAFQQLWPDAYDSIQHRLLQLRRDDTELIDRIVDGIRATLNEAGIEADISGREKSPISIWRKMQRKNISFEQLADIMAFRVLVDSVGECYAALGSIHAEYSMLPGRFKDFISTPKLNGYRSLHTTIIGPERRKIEVQIRTRQMHEVAELGVAAHWAYKQQDDALTDGRRYRWIRELLDILEHASSPEDFLEHTKLEMFQDQVFCFTPRGDLISLPRGSTPVDFAYAVHSEVGDHCIGARVDGRMVQLRTELDNGDQVEIITSRNAWPSAAWERFVATGKARARIRRYLKTKRREDLVQRGRTALQRVQRGSGQRITEKQLETAVGLLQQKSVEDMLVAVGEGNLAPRLIIERILPRTLQTRQDPQAQENLPEPGASLPLRRARGEGTAGDGGKPATIAGLPQGIAFQLAGCCRPVPGDPIVGVVRTGRPVSVHLSECRNVAQMDPASSRFIDVGWGEIDPEAYAAARLSVMVLNRPGALGTVTTIIGKQEANIADVRVGRKVKDLYEMILDVEVADAEQLLRIKAALRTSPIVVGVERVQS